MKTHCVIRNHEINWWLIFLIVLSGVLLPLVSNCMSGDIRLDEKQVISILKSGGFSGLLDDRAEVKQIGTIKKADSCLNLFVYVHTSESKGGAMGARHMVKRLIVLSESAYLGMYAIDEFPTGIIGDELKFPGEQDEGNSIVFDSKLPPNEIYLGGELHELFK